MYRKFGIFTMLVVYSLQTCFSLCAYANSNQETQEQKLLKDWEDALNVLKKHIENEAKYPPGKVSDSELTYFQRDLNDKVLDSKNIDDSISYIASAYQRVAGEKHPTCKLQIETAANSVLDERGLVKKWAETSEHTKNYAFRSKRETQEGEALRLEINRALKFRVNANAYQDAHFAKKADNALRLLLQSDQYYASGNKKTGDWVVNQARASMGYSPDFSFDAKREVSNLFNPTCRWQHDITNQPKATYVPRPKPSQTGIEPTAQSKKQETHLTKPAPERQKDELSQRSQSHRNEDLRLHLDPTFTPPTNVEYNLFPTHDLTPPSRTNTIDFTLRNISPERHPFQNIQEIDPDLMRFAFNTVSDVVDGYNRLSAESDKMDAYSAQAQYNYAAQLSYEANNRPQKSNWKEVLRQQQNEQKERQSQREQELKVIQERQRAKEKHSDEHRQAQETPRPKEEVARMNSRSNGQPEQPTPKTFESHIPEGEPNDETISGAIKRANSVELVKVWAEKFPGAEGIHFQTSHTSLNGKQIREAANRTLLLYILSDRKNDDGKVNTAKVLLERVMKADRYFAEAETLQDSDAKLARRFESRGERYLNEAHLLYAHGAEKKDDPIVSILNSAKLSETATSALQLDRNEAGSLPSYYAMALKNVLNQAAHNNAALNNDFAKLVLHDSTLEAIKAAKSNAIREFHHFTDIMWSIIDVAAGFVPWVGDVKDIFEAVTGQSLISGQSKTLSTEERFYAAAGIIVGNRQTWSQTSKIAKSATKDVEEILDISEDIAKIADKVAPTIKKTIEGAAQKLEEKLAATVGKIVDGIKITGRYNPSKPGPLKENIAKTFRGGSYIGGTLETPKTFYRVIGDRGNPNGEFWTSVKPEGALQSIIDFALDQNWGNTATRMVEKVFPSGTKIYEGFAASQRGLVGGGKQIYIPKVEK